MKILHVIPALGQGGAERLVINIVHELSKRPDVQAKLLTFRPENAYPFLTDLVEWEVVPARVVPSVLGKGMYEVDAYREALARFQPDVVHSHLFEAEMVSREVVSPNTLYVTHFHDNMPPFAPFSWRTVGSKDKLLRFYEKQHILRRYARCRNRFIAISRDGYAYLQRSLPAPFRAAAHLLPNAIELARFTPPNGYVRPASEALRLVSVGSLIPRKNHVFLIEVVAWLREKGCAVALDIVGGGAQEPLLREAITARGLDAFVTLHGYSGTPETHLHRADVYVHAAAHEPFGLVLVEAMAAGLPVVTTDGGGNRDLLRDGENGFLLPTAEVVAFAEKVRYLAEHPAERQKMGAQAQQFAQGFGMETYADALLALYATTHPHSLRK